MISTICEALSVRISIRSSAVIEFTMPISRDEDERFERNQQKQSNPMRGAGSGSGSSM
jgi:hypothetical protein